VKLQKDTFKVGILSDAAFDALTVDPLSIRLSGATVAPGPDAPCKVKDVNRDKRMDLVCTLSTAPLVPGTGVATLRAVAAGTPIVGRDTMNIVAPHDHGHENDRAPDAVALPGEREHAAGERDVGANRGRGHGDKVADGTDS
jgi:hypothetical protein